VTRKTEWYTLQDAALQLLPLQEDMPFVVASQISPSGMTLAGKYGIGIISLGSMSTQGLMALPTQWGFAEDAAKKAGTTVSRSDWRVLLSWHIAETREQAQREAGAGLMRWHNEYTVRTLQRPGVEPFKSPEDAVEKTAGGENAASTIGTPDDLVKTIKNLINVSGGVGAIIGFVHDWANPENTRRSWDMVARYVIPEINGYVTKLRESQKFLIENRAVFERARLQRNGMLSRSDARWDARVEDPEHWRDGASPKYYVLIELDGQGEAFAMYRVKSKWERGMSQSELVLVDAIATSAEATRELWRYLFGVDLIAKVSLWNYDPSTPLFLMVKDARRLQLRLTDGIWLRLVDVGEALRLRSYAGEGSVVLDVTDTFCPWNEGRYRAGNDAGPTEDAAELRLSAADLASAYLGAFSFERLAAAGRVEVVAEGAVARATALFRTELPPYCPEPF
jgi:hypothetical protein